MGIKMFSFSSTYRTLSQNVLTGRSLGTERERKELLYCAAPFSAWLLWKAVQDVGDTAYTSASVLPRISDFQLTLLGFPRGLKATCFLAIVRNT